MSLGFGVIGAGRIGLLHARNLAGGIDGARLACVMDASPQAAQRAAFAGAYGTQDLDALLRDPEVDAVLIASPTTRHAAQIAAAAAAGKAVFCEKPVALDLKETEAAMTAVEAAGLPFQIGFNRRFDAGFAEVARAVHAGELGRVEMFRSQSSDPAPPPEAYVATSGGIYLDSVIHDLDMARFVAGDILRVTALGRVLVAPYLADYGDVDTSVLTLEFASGAIGVIQNSRRTVHGYDLRLEVHGEAGKLVSEDERATKVWRYGEGGVRGDYIHYFIERFRDAYRAEVQAFVDAVRGGRPPSPGPRDAIEALRAATAARRSLHEGRPVKVKEIA
ncbi:MAG: inositol 2-dehydrogenase [Deinococcota bacterium]|nr:inositol 2-dehydrogenase [Deinococcota bacterium]